MKICLAIFFSVLLLCECNRGPHFITDAAYRSIVEHDFKTKRQALSGAPENLFAVFDKPITLEEREALQFLYAYSPLVDLTESGGDFLLWNVRLALNIKREMPWGKEIPEAIFRHFVLPVRGSNESLDSSRIVFYRELRDRVMTCKTMEEAALEVNHWCHEKAIYMSTDARTCSPMTLLTTTYGRCGEESIFALAALRSVGIPARQVYTPRWAHCDDNHAWIEVWVDGTWKYLGACEPEPRLNIAWFTAPIRRGVLMQARVFGKYSSNEEVVFTTSSMTHVNVTGCYTDVKKVTVEVVDDWELPISGAKVEYKIYNYGEFYPVATLQTDNSGQSTLTLGLGDWLIWASKGGRYGFAPLRAAKDDRVRIVLDKTGSEQYNLPYSVTPPVEKEYQALVPDEERAENDRRFMREDSIRNAYIATFIRSTEAAGLAEKYGVNRDLFIKYTRESRGNYEEIIRFIEETKPEQRPVAMELLQTIATKDLQDGRAGILSGHLLSAIPFKDKPQHSGYLLGGVSYDDLFRNYILNPRIKNEPITAWRKPLQQYMTTHHINSVETLVREMGNIRVVDSLNAGGLPMSPIGVLRSMVTDMRSKELFFVAACRTMGTAARLNPVNGKPEYNAGQGWTPAIFTQENIVPKGELMIFYTGQEVKDPLYYTHFTISKLYHGVARSLDLGSNSQVDMGAGASWRTIFRAPVSLEEGDYVLTTGNRRSDGSVSSRITAFHITADSITRLDMNIRSAAEEINILGYIDPRIKFITEDNKSSNVQWPAKGYTAVAYIMPNKEPVNHLIRDISAMKEDFEKKGITLTFLFPNKEQCEKFSRHDFRPLPSTLTLGYDVDNRIINMLTERLQLKNPDNLPLIIMANKKGEVIYISQGYRIGLGTQIMRRM